MAFQPGDVINIARVAWDVYNYGWTSELRASKTSFPSSTPCAIRFPRVSPGPERSVGACRICPSSSLFPTPAIVGPQAKAHPRRDGVLAPFTLMTASIPTIPPLTPRPHRHPICRLRRRVPPPLPKPQRPRLRRPQGPRVPQEPRRPRHEPDKMGPRVAGRHRRRLQGHPPRVSPAAAGQRAVRQRER